PLLALLRRPTPPPTATLFPYTTLFRSWLIFGWTHVGEEQPGQLLDGVGGVAQRVLHDGLSGLERLLEAMPASIVEPAVVRASDRSEEHTSELQSLRHLVCRLLLEKKKD